VRKIRFCICRKGPCWRKSGRKCISEFGARYVAEEDGIARVVDDGETTEAVLREKVAEALNGVTGQYLPLHTRMTMESPLPSVTLFTAQCPRCRILHLNNTMVCLYPHWPSSKPGSHLRKEDSPLVFLHGRAKAPKAANDAVSSQHAPCFRQLSEVPAAMGLGRLCTGTAYNQPLRPTPDHLFPPHPSLSIPSTLP
jgi:hypothetical protein